MRGDLLVLAPVVVFVYDRPEHTIKTIEALADNYLAKETNIYFFSDAAKSKQSEENVALVRDYIDSLTERNYFKTINIEKAQQNRGLANSVITGVTQIIKKYGKIIVVEDDLVSSVDFLQYMNDALDYYESNNKIWSISGYNIPIEIPNNYKSEIYLSYRGCSWGWATWKDRWEEVDWDVSDYQEFKRNKKMRKKLNRGGRDMANMLDLQMHGTIDSWAIRWCYTQSKLDMYTVYPVISRIKNIGLDGTGTHNGLTTRYDSILNSDYKKCNFDYPELNAEILSSFRNYYMSKLEYILLKPKNLVKRFLRK